MQLRYWQKLSPANRTAALTRPALGNDAALASRVAEIIGEVRAKGDTALRELTAKLDRVELDDLEVGPAEFAAAEAALTREQRSAIHAAADNIETFHRPQLPLPFAVDTVPGVRCERVVRAIERQRELRTMKRLDVVGRRVNGRALLTRECRFGGRELRGTDLELVELDAVELGRQLAQRGITLGAHRADDLCDAR